MDRRTLLFVGISVAIIVLYQEFVLKQFAPPPSAVDAPVAAIDGETAPIPPMDAPLGTAQTTAGAEEIAPLLPPTET